MKNLFRWEALPRLYQPVPTLTPDEHYVLAIDDRGAAVATFHTHRDVLRVRLAP